MSLTRRTLLAAAVAGAAFTVLAPGAPARAQSDGELRDLVYGDADAPVEVIEYASLSCPHCKTFHDEVFPVLKEEYIDTGKIKFVYRDFPTNSPALAAAMIARCAGPDRHGAMVDLFFETQSQWGRSENPLQALTMVARMAGIGPNEVDACLKNSDMLQAINDQARRANEELGVAATPTLFVAGEKVEPTDDLDVVRKAIDAALE